LLDEGWSCRTLWRLSMGCTRIVGA
jgi:hypothetical protein